METCVNTKYLAYFHSYHNGFEGAQPYSIELKGPVQFNGRFHGLHSSGNIYSESYATQWCRNKKELTNEMERLKNVMQAGGYYCYKQD